MKGWWLRLGSYALPHWRGLTLVLLLMFLGVGLDTLNPWPLKLIVDCALSGQPLPNAFGWLAVLPGGSSAIGLLGWLAGSTVLLFLSHRAVKMTQSYVSAGVGARLTYSLGAALFDHLQSLSLSFHCRKHRGDLVRRVTVDSTCVRELVMGVVLPIFTSLTSLVVMLAVMWQLDRSLSLLAILVAPILGILMGLFNSSMTKRTYEHQQLEGEMMALAEQTLTSLPLVQAFGREEREEKRFRHLSRHTLRAYLQVLLSQLQFKVGVSTVTCLGQIGVMLIGGFHVLEGRLTVGSLLVFNSYLASLYAPMETLAYLSMGFASAEAKAQRVLEVLDVQERVRELPGARPIRSGAGRGHVCLEGVTFGYEPGLSVLQEVTLEARPGETVALVGPTGAGKSTLISLIPRFFDPWRGQVIFDGRDVREIQLASLRSQISLVLQEPFLLPLSVAENIAYGRPGSSFEQIVASAVAANADDFIRQLPQGYDTVIGERGATLSGGQRQRLAIARALLKDAPVLILDEPTSALDAETEAILMEALERLMVGRTTFIIAHRLSTIQKADLVAVLKEGRIVEIGSHQKLLEARGHYHRLHTL